MTRLAYLLASLALLVSVAGLVAVYQTYRPDGLGEWSAAAADFGALAFADTWLAAVAATAVAATVLAWLLRRRPRDPEEGWGSRRGAKRRRLAGLVRVVAGLSWLVLAAVGFRVPLEVALGPLARDAGLDHLVPPAPGLVLRVAAEPPGGRLEVNGIDRGTVPMIANVICKEGRPIRLRIEKEGFATWEREYDCQEGQTLLVEARLEK